jgi:outer membrane protein
MPVATDWWRARAALALAVVCTLTASRGKAEEQVLTLGEAVKTAMEQNPALLSSRENLNAAGYKANQLLAGYLPQASAVASYSRATYNYVSRAGSVNPSALAGMLAGLGGGAAGAGSSILPKDPMESADFYSAGVSVNQLLYDFGRTGGAYEASKAEQDASGHDLESTVNGVQLTVTQAFFGVLAAQELLQAATQAQRQMAKHLELAQAQVAAGARPLIDVTRARVDLANANLTLVRATNQLAIAKSSLNAAMGVERSVAFRVEKPASAAAPEMFSLEEAVRIGFENRPEYRARKSRVASQRDLVGVARAGFFPSLGANGNFVYAGKEVNDLSYNWTAGASLSWSFFSGFATVNAVDEAQARTRSLEASLQSLALAVRNEVETAFLAYREAQQKTEPTQAGLAAAKETLELAEGRYQSGAGNIVEVTDAQSSFTQAQVSAIAAEYDIEVARARLLYAMGLIASR